MTAAETQLLTMIVNRLDALDSRLDGIDTRMTQSESAAGESRRRMHERQEGQGELLVGVSHRLEAVEKAVDGAAPALKEYADTKVKVAAAGALGRLLWKAGKWLLGIAVALYALRHDLSAWWQWFMQR